MIEILGIEHDEVIFRWDGNDFIAKLDTGVLKPVAIKGTAESYDNSDAKFSNYLALRIALNNHCRLETEKEKAASKVFNALWRTRLRGDSVPVALEQQGVDVIAPDDQDKRDKRLAVTCDGFEFFLVIQATNFPANR